MYYYYYIFTYDVFELERLVSFIHYIFSIIHRNLKLVGFSGIDRYYEN